MKLKNLLQRRNPEKFKESRECFSDNLTSAQKFRGPIFGSIALMLKVYANDANHQDSEKILIVDSVNKAFETLKIVFTRRVDILPKDVDSQQHSESSKSLTTDESKCWYPSCISRYFQDCQRQNQHTSLCKTMTKTCTTTSEPRMFVAYRKRETRVEYTQQDLVDIANVLMKLKKYLKQHCQRQRLIAAGKVVAKSSNNSCDKAVQCDYLQVSPEVRFFSRSSLVINATEGKPHQQQQERRQNSSPSLEYVANYRPEFHARSNNNKSLRSLSSSAIFGLSREKLNYSRSPPRRNTRLKRGGVPSLDTMKRRTEDDMHLYSNFIEADLTSFHYNQKFRTSESTQLDRTDVLAVRKILLDDYITEVKEIIRSELSDSESPNHESQILDSVRKRIDEDVSLSRRTGSHDTLSPTTSYVTARECISSCCCCCCLCDCKDSNTCLKLCELSCSKCKVPGKNCMSYLANKDRYSKIVNEDKSSNSTSAKSSQSVDSGVQMDFPHSSATTTIATDCNSSDDLSLFNDFKNIQKKSTSCCSESTSSSSGSCSTSDEMLCRRVESAVRKFTEKLIVCERRARDRSRSRTSCKSQQNPRLKGCTSLTDQTRYKLFNCLGRDDELVNCSSEDERITGISTPSLVSLSDEEIRP